MWVRLLGPAALGTRNGRQVFLLQNPPVAQFMSRYDVSECTHRRFIVQVAEVPHVTCKFPRNPYTNWRIMPAFVSMTYSITTATEAFMAAIDINFL
jgi:hypothetical protein